MLVRYTQNSYVKLRKFGSCDRQHYCRIFCPNRVSTWVMAGYRLAGQWQPVDRLIDRLGEITNLNKSASELFVVPGTPAVPFQP
jgi:hypothetical protein